MRLKALIAITLAWMPWLFAAETISEATPLWSVRLEGAGPAPVWADAERVIVSDSAEGTPNYKCFRSSDGKALWVTDSENHNPGQDVAANAARPFVRGNVAYLQFANGDFFYQYLSGGSRNRDAYNIAEAYDARQPLKGYAASPLLYDGTLFIMPGAQAASIVALHLMPGENLWETPGRRASRSDFIAGEFGGVKQLVGFDHDSLGGWAVETGTRLWQLDTPDRVEDAFEKLFESRGRVLASTSDGVTALYGFKPGGMLDEKPIARNAEGKGRIEWLAGRLALGLGGGVYALDVDDNLRECWRLNETDVPRAAFLVIDGAQLFIFGSDGTLAVFDFTAAKTDRVAMFKLIDSIVAQPAMANGRLFVRGKIRLSCFEFTTLGLSKKP